ncbi:MAG: peptidylprolyl isomerase [Vicinamibacterales bacterium]
MRWTSVALLTILAFTAVPRADVLQQILVKVNGDIITKTEFEQRQVSALRQRNQQFANDDDLKKAISEVTPDLVLAAVDELLLQQRGRELGFKMTDDNFKRIVEQIRTENKLESEAQFEAALKQEGMTLLDLRKALERQMLVTQVQQQEVMGKIAITDDEAKAYYEQHRTDFTTPPSITLREILVAVAESKDARGQAAVNVGADDDAKARAEALRGRVKAGEDFAKLAGELSDAPSKANGGIIGPISPDELAPEFAKLVKSLKVGDVSAPVRTSRGYQIFKLEASTEPVIETFDQARDKIASKVFDGKRQSEVLKYLDKLRAQAIIEWKNDELKKAYEKALSTRKSGAPDTADKPPSA